MLNSKIIKTERGGPSTVDAGRSGMVSDISQACNRSAAYLLYIDLNINIIQVFNF